MLTHVQLGQTFAMLTANIQVLLNSADEWVEKSNIVYTGIAAHDPSISSRNAFRVVGFIRNAASFTYINKWKSRGVKSRERGWYSTLPLRPVHPAWKFNHVAPDVTMGMWGVPSCWQQNSSFPLRSRRAGARGVPNILCFLTCILVKSWK